MEILEYSSVPGGSANEKYLTKINLKPYEEDIRVGTMYLIAACHPDYLPYILESEYNPLDSKSLMVIKQKEYSQELPLVQLLTELGWSIDIVILRDLAKEPVLAADK